MKTKRRRAISQIYDYFSERAISPAEYAGFVCAAMRQPNKSKVLSFWIPYGKTESGYDLAFAENLARTMAGKNGGYLGYYVSDGQRWQPVTPEEAEAKCIECEKQYNEKRNRENAAKNLERQQIFAEAKRTGERQVVR